MIVAISAVSESGDHYLYCKTGSVNEIVKSLEGCTDFAFWGNVRVSPLATGEWATAAELKYFIIEAIDKAYDNL